MIENRPYIFNKETLKIELHFEKTEYDALSVEEKSALKSNFLWSRSAKAWVSRAKEGNLWRAKQVAEKLGFVGEETQGERLSFAEQVNRSVERAEARAERYEEYASNAAGRAAAMQKPLHDMHGDIAFFTQPIIAGHAGSQRFARQREKMFDRYRKGFEEYRKSEYFLDRAATAQYTADMRKFKDPVYLDNRIKECKKNIRAMEKNMVRYEEILYSLEKHTEEKTSSYVDRYTPEQVGEWIENLLERIEAEMDKQGYIENCLEEIGGNRFSQENIKPGYIVKMQRWGRCEIVSVGPVNVSYKILDGGAAGGVLTDAYAAILEILTKKEAPKIENPFHEGDIVCRHRPADDSIMRAYQVVKTTATGVKIQQIAVKDGFPQPGEFISDKIKQKKVTKSKWSDFVGIYDDDRQLHKYNSRG